MSHVTGTEFLHSCGDAYFTHRRGNAHTTAVLARLAMRANFHIMSERVSERVNDGIIR